MTSKSRIPEVSSFIVLFEIMLPCASTKFTDGLGVSATGVITTSTELLEPEAATSNALTETIAFNVKP